MSHSSDRIRYANRFCSVQKDITYETERSVMYRSNAFRGNTGFELSSSVGAAPLAGLEA